SSLVVWQQTRPRDVVAPAVPVTAKAEEPVVPANPTPAEPQPAPTRDEVPAPKTEAKSEPASRKWPEHVVIGRLLDDVSARPVQGASVIAGRLRARHAPGERTTRSGEDGRFRFEHVDYDHATSLIVESTDHAPLAQPLSPQLAAEAELVDVGDVHLIN